MNEDRWHDLFCAIVESLDNINATLKEMKEEMDDNSCYGVLDRIERRLETIAERTGLCGLTE